MSLYNGPPRAGARGGKDQFSWENVRSDKDREFYLGHSVKALTGRWQKGKDVYWYTRDKDAQDTTLQDELRAVKAREEEVMMEALGLKPKTVQPLAPAALDSRELAQLLKRRGGEGDEEGAPPALGLPGAEAEGDKQKGLGFSAQRAMGTITKSDSLTMELGATMAGVGIQAGSKGPAAVGPAAGQGQQQLPGPPPLSSSGGLVAMVRAGLKLSSEQIKALGEPERKAVKKARKEAKKAKKAAKKAARKKHKKKQARSSDSSSGSSSGSESDEKERQRGGKSGSEPGDRVAGGEGFERGGRRADEEGGRGRVQQRRHDSPEPGRGDCGREGREGLGRDREAGRAGGEGREERGGRVRREDEGRRTGRDEERDEGRWRERDKRRGYERDEREEGRSRGREGREEGRPRGREEREEQRSRGGDRREADDRGGRRPEEDAGQRTRKRGRHDSRSPSRSRSPRARRHDTP